MNRPIKPVIDIESLNSIGSVGAREVKAKEINLQDTDCGGPSNRSLNPVPTYRAIT